MFKFLLFLFIVFLLIVIIGSMFIGNILRALFKGVRRTSPNEQAQTEETSQGTSRKQIFGDDEGEYVDFEEIKDGDKNKK